MVRIILMLSTLFILLSAPVISHAQEKCPCPCPQQASEEDELIPTKFEIFLNRPDKVVVTRSYDIGKLTNRGIDHEVTAVVAWVLDESERSYAANVAGCLVDFEELKVMEEGIGMMIKGITESFDKLEATSMSYNSARGLFTIDYRAFEASSGAPRQRLNLNIGKYKYTGPGPRTTPLDELRTLINQAHAKLAALGAR